MSAAVTEFTDEITGPFRKLGKWDKTVVPHDGWRCIRIVDHGKQNHTCDMCEAREVRYVHWMEHDDFTGVLKVGCECAGRLERNPDAAEERERVMRNRAARRAKWPARKWRVSRKGNPYLRRAGYCFTVWPKGAGWSFAVSREDEAPHYADATFTTCDQAKLAAFDLIWPAVSHGM
jgi:hypothetical protein